VPRQSELELGHLGRELLVLEREAQRRTQTCFFGSKRQPFHDERRALDATRGASAFESSTTTQRSAVERELEGPVRRARRSRDERASGDLAAIEWKAFEQRGRARAELGPPPSAISSGSSPS
jgi:hypothetical protein